jgi:hypothetical protein
MSIINKALSQEEMTLISNMKSGLDQLLQMQTASSPVDQTQIAQESINKESVDEMETPPIDDKKKEDMEKAKKAIETTPGDQPAAQDPAEDRIDEVIPEASEEKLNEVAKALLKIINKSQTKVQKSEINPVVSVIDKVVKTLQTQDEKINSMANAFEQLLDGLGVSKQIEIVQKSQQPERRPIMNTDKNEVIKFLSDALSQVKKEEKSDQPNQSNVVRKNLSDPILTNFLFAGKNKKENE